MRTSGLFTSGWATLPASGTIVLAAVLAYRNSLDGPFIFDNLPAIVENPAVCHLWPIWRPLCPPNNGRTVAGRPLLNLSFAVNYAISGVDVWSYHAANLAIHVLAGLLLFGILRRTFHDRNATLVAFAVALFWTIHPLQTESVTYIAERAESLAGLFYLLTLYCFIRGAMPGGRRAWYAAAVTACLLGMASKEVMVSAPLMVLLYDRAFLAGSFREAWRRRRGVYLALAATWLLLGWLVIAAGNRGGTAGFGEGVKIGSWAYLCTQFGAIVHYLRLCVWPHPLVLDYGAETVSLTLAVLLDAILVCLLALATLIALWRWPKVGFLGAWFFAILAPTSSIVPVASQVVAEHRMYLPLAAVATAVTLGVYDICCRLSRGGLVSRRSVGVVCVLAASVAAVALGVVTHRRNADYRSELSIWQDTVDKSPRDDRARSNLGMALLECGRFDEAIVQLQRALEINADVAGVHNNLGIIMARRGQMDEAIVHFQKAVDLQPGFVGALNNLGNALAAKNRFDEAMARLRQALKLSPILRRPTTTSATHWLPAASSTRRSSSIVWRCGLSPISLKSTTALAAPWPSRGGWMRRCSIIAWLSASSRTMPMPATISINFRPSH